MYNLISRGLDVPKIAHYRQKYLIKNESASIPENLEQEIFKEKIIYLITFRPDYQVWVRSRTCQNGITVHSYCERKMASSESERYEKTRQIGGDTFFSYHKQRNPSFEPLSKQVTNFIYNNSLYQLEEYKRQNGKNLRILRVNLDNSRNVEIPRFLGEVEDIGEEEKYFTHNLAKKDNKVL